MLVHRHQSSAPQRLSVKHWGLRFSLSLSASRSGWLLMAMGSSLSFSNNRQPISHAGRNVSCLHQLALALVATSFSNSAQSHGQRTRLTYAPNKVHLHPALSGALSRSLPPFHPPLQVGQGITCHRFLEAAPAWGSPALPQDPAKGKQGRLPSASCFPGTVLLQYSSPCTAFLHSFLVRLAPEEGAIGNSNMSAANRCNWQRRRCSDYSNSWF
jgi:hypothetical protein